MILFIWNVYQSLPNLSVDESVSQSTETIGKAVIKLENLISLSSSNSNIYNKVICINNYIHFDLKQTITQNICQSWAMSKNVGITRKAISVKGYNKISRDQDSASNMIAVRKRDEYMRQDNQLNSHSGAR